MKCKGRLIARTFYKISSSDDSSLSSSSKSDRVNTAKSILSCCWSLPSEIYFLFSILQPSSPIRSRVSKLSLDNLLRQSVLTRFMRENIHSNFALVNGQTNKSSIMSKTLWHSFTVTSLVNTNFQISKYLDLQLLEIIPTMYVFKHVHSLKIFSRLQLLASSNWEKWLDSSCTILSPNPPISFFGQVFHV